MIRGPWFVGCPPVEERVGVCAPAQIFRGRCAGFFAHLRSGYFSFWFCKSHWFLGLGVEGDFGEGDAQVFCERLKGTTTTRRHDGGRERGGAEDAVPPRRDSSGKLMWTRCVVSGQWPVVSGSIVGLSCSRSAYLQTSQLVAKRYRRKVQAGTSSGRLLRVL